MSIGGACLLAFDVGLTGRRARHGAHVLGFRQAVLDLIGVPRRRLDLGKSRVHGQEARVAVLSLWELGSEGGEVVRAQMDWRRARSEERLTPAPKTEQSALGFTLRRRRSSGRQWELRSRGRFGS